MRYRLKRLSKETKAIDLGVIRIEISERNNSYRRIYTSRFENINVYIMRGNTV